MLPNFYVIGACAFIPFFIAYAWFHPKAFGGDTWKNVANLTDAQMSKAISPLQLIFSVFLNALISMGIFILTVHGTHVVAMTGPDMEALKTGTAQAFLQEYGNNFHTLQHGISHGLVMGLIFFVVPILGYAVIFERKSMKYFLVNAGFWGISLVIMAMIISRWGGTPVF